MANRKRRIQPLSPSNMDIAIRFHTKSVRWQHRKKKLVFHSGNTKQPFGRESLPKLHYKLHPDLHRPGVCTGVCLKLLS